jgi:muconolactone delta-isomerase
MSESNSEINRIAAEAHELLKDIPPERLLSIMAKKARSFGFKEQERAFKSALRRLWLRRLWEEVLAWGSWMAFDSPAPGSWGMQLARIFVWMDILHTALSYLPNPPVH